MHLQYAVKGPKKNQTTEREKKLVYALFVLFT